MTSPRFNNAFLDSLFTQWLLGLGEFEMNEVTDESEDMFQSVKVLLYIYFLLATLIS